MIADAGALDVAAEELGVVLVVVDVEGFATALVDTKVVVEVIKDIDELEDVVLVVDGVVISIGCSCSGSICG